MERYIFCPWNGCESNEFVLRNVPNRPNLKIGTCKSCDKLLWVENKQHMVGRILLEEADYSLADKRRKYSEKQ